MIKRNWISMLFLLGLVSCSGFPKPAPPDSPILTTVSVSTSSLRTETPQPAQTTSTPTMKIPETSTVFFTPTITSTPVPEIPILPVEILDRPPKGIALEGFLALYDYSKQAGGSDELSVDLKTGSVTVLNLFPGPARTFCHAVSPNRDRIVCKADDKIYILDKQGKPLISTPWKENWLIILGWLDNDRLLILKHEPPLAATIVYDPFENVEVEIPSDYPNISNLEPFDNFGNYSATASFYNPSLEYVVYPSLDWNNIVWDRKQSKVIAEIPIGYANPYPQWSPDGQEVVLAGRRNRPDLPDTEQKKAMDVYLVSNSGEVVQATDLSVHFSNSWMFDLSWSPDGRLIAFLLETDDTSCESRCIMILDPVTLTLRGFELPAGYFVNAAEYPVYRLTWSPDGRQLLLNVATDANPEKTVLVVLDIYDNQAFEIAKDSRILGWMGSNP